MKMQKGFTLIELMIVVAIIAILAAIAIGQYQDYVIRSQVSEGAVLADSLKTAAAEFYQNNGRFPPANESAGAAAAASIVGTYVSEVDIGSTTPGVIEATYESTAPQKANAKIDGLILQFSAVSHAGSISWVCKSGTIQDKWLPSSCRN